MFVHHGYSQLELNVQKGLEMRKWVLSGILAGEEAYLSHLEALLLVSLQALLGLFYCKTAHKRGSKITIIMVLSFAHCTPPRWLQMGLPFDLLFFILAHEAPESCCHHFPAHVNPPADRNHFLQSAWAPWDPQRLLWWPVTQSSTVEPPSMCGWPLPETGE